jgi:hypothetical protein
MFYALYLSFSYFVFLKEFFLNFLLYIFMFATLHYNYVKQRRRSQMKRSIYSNEQVIWKFYSKLSDFFLKKVMKNGIKGFSETLLYNM